MQDTTTPAVPMEPPMPTENTQMKHDHWFVQVVGGVTIANTVVSGLAMFWLFLTFVVLPTA